MARNGKAFISHTAQDDAQIKPLLAALKSKHVDVWYDHAPAEALDGSLSPETQREIEGRDVFIRILSQHTASSKHMELELAAFQQTQALDEQRGEGDRRARINLIVDPTYERQPTDVGAMTINTTNKSESAWLPSVFSTLGKLKASSVKYSTGGLAALAVLAAIIALLALIGITLLSFAHAGHPLLFLSPGH